MRVVSTRRSDRFAIYGVADAPVSELVDVAESWLGDDAEPRRQLRDDRSTQLAVLAASHRGADA